MPSSTALKFTLSVGDLAEHKFRVLEFTLSESVSECFRLHVEVATDGDSAFTEMIGKDATLTVVGEDFPITHYGVVTEFNQYPDGAGNFGRDSVLYDILIEPHLKLLEYTTQNRIFQEMDVKEIVTKVLEGADLKAGSHYRFALKGSLAKREYTVQYNETDLNFVQRLLEDEGIFYYFDHEGEKDVLVMMDSTDLKPLPELPTVAFEGQSGLTHQGTDHVLSMRRTQRMVTGKVTLKDYNDRTPEVKVIGTSVGKGQGEMYGYGPGVKTTGEAKHMATLRAEMLACEKERLNGEGICRSFRAGYRFELTDGGAVGGFEGKYLLIKVEHHGDQREGFEGDATAVIYSNRFTCMPAATVFRPPQISPKPKINGVLTAKVDGQAGPYAYLDEEGRYHAKLPFDLTSATDGQASLPIRMAQPYGGPDYGMHFPVHNGNDMVLGFVDGDVDRPIALGTMPNPSNGTPVTSRNKSESVIKTASGHIWRMDDLEGETIVDLTTAGNHLLALNDKPDTKEIRIKTSGGHLFVMDDTGKNVTILTTGGHTVKIDDAANSITVETKGGHSLVMDDPGKKIALKDGQGVNAIELDGGGKVLSLSSTGDIKIDAGKNIIMTAKEAINGTAGKDMTLHADGAVSVTADKTMVQEAKKDYTLKAKKIGITAETDYIVAAKKIDFKADNDFKVVAGKVNMKSDGDVILKGSKIAQN